MLVVLGLAAVLAMPAPFAAGPTGTAQPLDGGPAVAFRTDAPVADVLGVGARILQSYASFHVALGPERTRAALVALGYRADPISDASTLRFLGGSVEAGDLGRSAAAWTRDEGGTSTGIVHVAFPFREAWRGSWEARGVEILRYIPTNGYLVRGTPDAIASLTQLPEVDGVGPYSSAWKLRPDVPGAGIVDTRIVILPGGRGDGVVAWLGSNGVPSDAPRSGAGPGLVGAYGSDDLRWIRARVPAHLLPGLAALPQVEFIEPVAQPRLQNRETVWALQVGTNATLRYWVNGLDGRGQVIAISDTGVDYDNRQFAHSASEVTLGDLYNVTDASRRKVVRYLNMGVLSGQLDWPGGSLPWDEWSIKDSRHVSASCTFGHGTAVASTLTGNDNGLGSSANDGLALGASLYVQDIGTVVPGTPCSTDELGYLPEDYADLFGPSGLVYEDPVAPVRIHSNSWGTDTNAYDVQARMVDAFVWAHPDLTVLFASGNAGSAAGTVGTPGTAKNILTVGGAGNPDSAGSGGLNDVALQSSRGPTADGRMKPTIMTIFDGDSAMSDGNPFTSAAFPDSHWAGTSYSTPAAAAAAAIVRQYFVDGWYPTAGPVAGNSRNPSAALVRATLIASGSQMTGTDSRRAGVDRWPNNEQGYGRVLLSNVLPIAGAGDTFRTQVVDDGAGLVTGETATYAFRVTGPRAVRFVLAWSDFPGAVEAAKALVNDLDLEVTAPDGTVYKGNVFGTFAQGESIPALTIPSDATNVEEAVLLKTPASGTWTVRVIASNIPVGPQPFALLATGDLDAGYGRVHLDRRTYGPGDSVGIAVEDGDASAVQVTVRSDFESAGETVGLGRAAPGEVWRGTVALGIGATAADGVVQVRDGDELVVEYDDLSPVHTAAARARIDAVGPTISDVRADPPLTTSARIRWRTDEPATSGVRYGTTPTNLTGLAEDTDLRRVHDLLVTGLQADTVHYFDVVSRDRGGRETRDTAGGRHYRIQTDTFGDVLLVIGDDTHPPDREAKWRNALDAHGWSWSLWRVSESGLPPLSILRGPRAVAWQVGLEEYPPFAAAARDLVKQYLDGGGRLLVSSHDTTWSFADSSTSQFYSREAHTWVRGVLKADFVCDPIRATQLVGRPGDPISGAFTGGVSYAPHRDGGSVDGLTVLSIGGPAVTVWTDDQVTPTSCRGDPVALRWISSAPNGTAGVGAWGGTPSRLVYFAFELTGLDATAADPRPTSATRALVLDNALRWLMSVQAGALDRDHPDVVVAAPNAGSYVGSNVPINWTATVGSAPIAGFDLSYSPDFGQTWSPIGTVPGSSRTHAWDVSGVPNGDGYLVRIVAGDSGAPSLQGRDESDGPFTIRRAGGDVVGPTAWAGSVRPSPNPPGAGTVAWINATVDDRASGGSRIAAAEYFVGTSEPAPADAGTGTPMEPGDGAFDEPLEAITWSDALALAPSTYCAWVHAQDGAGNWGPYESTCFAVVDAGPDTTPPGTGRPSVARLTNGDADVEITWARARDDGLFGGATAYRVLRSTSPRSAGTPISGTIPATGAATYTFVDPGVGSDPADYFYRVEAEDEAGNVASPSVAFAAKVRLALDAGPNLLGMPVETADASIAAIARAASWSAAWTYDACAAGPRWASALPADTTSFDVPLGRGVWLNASGGDTIVVVGVVPAIPQVTLCAGWNLVALAGFAQGVTVAAVKAATGADRVAGSEPTDPYGTRILGDTEVLAEGRGVWIRVPADVAWTPPGS